MRKFTPPHLLLGASAILCCQCGSSGAVGPAGGSVSSGDGVSIQVPAGALAEELTIKISPSSAWRQGMLSASAYQFEPEGLKFLKPALITMPFTRNIGLPDNVEESVHLFRAPLGSSDFQDLGGVSVVAGQIQAETPGFSVFLAGTALPAKVATGQKYPRGLTANATHVYWSNFGHTGMPLSGSSSRIMRAALGAVSSTSIGAPEIFADGQMDARHLAIDATNSYLYWINGGSGPGKNDAGVMRMPLTGGTPTRLIAATYPVDLALDSTYVYWLDSDLQTVNRAKLDGSSSTVLYASGPKPVGLALGASSKIYWLNRGTTGLSDGQVKSSPAFSFLPPTVLASAQAEPVDLAADTSGIYWVNRGDGKVRRVAVDGSALTTLQTLKRPTAIALDSASYYVTDSILGRVIAYAKATNTGVARSYADGIPSRIVPTASNLFWVNEGVKEYVGEINVIGK